MTRVRNRQVLLRFYSVIVVGLIVVATLLDFGFSKYQNALDGEAIDWVRGNFVLLENSLTETTEADWPQVVRVLERSLGFSVSVLPAHDIVSVAEQPGDIIELLDPQGRRSLHYRSSVLNATIQIGPLAAARPGEAWFVRLVPALFYLAILILVAIWLWPLIRDLNTLSDSAERFAADYRAPIESPGDGTIIKDLAQSFSSMAARIRDLIAGQKELTSALSHEMRTPLTRIKFALAMIRDKDQSIAAEGLASIEQDVGEIDQLIGTMLDYARLDHPDLRMERQDTPVTEWLQQIIAKAQMQACNIAINDSSQQEYINIDPYLMGLAVSNLLANACRYADKQIRIDFRSTATKHELQIHDDGRGIPESQRAAVLKAFTRLDSSRSRDTGGYGLGLAIVARIAALHGGGVSVKDSDLGGACISVEWIRP